MIGAIDTLLSVSFNNFDRYRGAGCNIYFFVFRSFFLIVIFNWGMQRFSFRVLYESNLGNISIRESRLKTLKRVKHQTSDFSVVIFSNIQKLEAKSKTSLPAKIKHLDHEHTVCTYHPKIHKCMYPVHFYKFKWPSPQRLTFLSVLADSAENWPRKKKNLSVLADSVKNFCVLADKPTTLKIFKADSA